MGALAGVVVSPGCPAVLGSPPDCVSLAPEAWCPRPLLLLPSGFGRYSANQSEKIINSYSDLKLAENGVLSALHELQLTRVPPCPTFIFLCSLRRKQEGVQSHNGSNCPVHKTLD